MFQTQQLEQSYSRTLRAHGNQSPSTTQSRSLKAQPNSDAWIETLPLILLGIRTALKEDLNATTAEMVYGTTLRLPGEFFSTSSATPLPDPSEFINQLKTHFRTLQSTPPRATNRISHIPNDLSTATHVFVRQDAIRKPLQPPYNGPYPVVKRTPKHFTVHINGRNNTISIDRLKPAHLDSTNTTDNVLQPEHSQTPTISHTPTSQSPSHSHTPTTHTRTTRSGRRVHFPAYLSHNM